MTTEKPKDSLNSTLAGFKSIVRFVTWLNVVVYRVSGGKLMNKSEGKPVCLVTMTGHKSGKQKTIALMHVADGDDVLLVASLGGNPKNPLWYYNLKAQPDIEIQFGSVRRKMRAREATPAERGSVWPKAVAGFPSFADYQQRTTREIPVFICSPRG